MRPHKAWTYDDTWREKVGDATLSGSIAILVATGLLLSLF